MSMNKNPILGRRYKYTTESILKLNDLQVHAKDSIEGKLLSGIYALEDVACFCGSNSDVLLAERDRYGLRVSTVICTQCGLIRANPRMTQRAYKSFYDCEYRSLYTGIPKPSESFFREQYIRGARIYSLVKHYIDGGTVFDIGCGAGGVLSAFQQANWQVAGVDFGEEYLEYGLRQGVENLFKGTSEELFRFGKKANLIILSHVFEHFLDIRSEIGTINQLIDPEGLIYIEIPGIKSLYRTYEGDFLRLLQNAHTYYFNLSTLEYVLNSCGYELIQGNEVIESLFKIAQPEIRIIGDMGSEYKMSVDYLKRIETRRRWGITKIRPSYILRIVRSLLKPFNVHKI